MSGHSFFYLKINEIPKIAQIARKFLKMRINPVNNWIIFYLQSVTDDIVNYQIA